MGGDENYGDGAVRRGVRSRKKSRKKRLLKKNTKPDLFMNI